MFQVTYVELWGVNVRQKNSFTKVVQLFSKSKGMSSEADYMQSFGHKSSFRHNLKHASNQKASFIKVAQFGSLIKVMSYKDNDLQSFGN
jgi:hypothetical protein